jgi:hypothetical protein
MEFWHNLMPVHTGILNLLEMYVLIKWKLHWQCDTSIMEMSLGARAVHSS